MNNIAAGLLIGSMAIGGVGVAVKTNHSPGHASSPQCAPIKALNIRAWTGSASPPREALLVLHDGESFRIAQVDRERGRWRYCLRQERFDGGLELQAYVYYLADVRRETAYTIRQRGDDLIADWYYAPQ